MSKSPKRQKYSFRVGNFGVGHQHPIWLYTVFKWGRSCANGKGKTELDAKQKAKQKISTLKRKDVK